MKNNEFENLSRLPRKERHLMSRVMVLLDKKGVPFNFYNHICEIGYDDALMITANWNNAPERLFEFIEKRFEGAVIPEWDDEWTACDNCGGAVRTSPSSFVWIPSYVETREGVICHDCYEECAEGIIEDHLNNPHKAVPPEFVTMLEKHGFLYLPNADLKSKTFFTGLHAHMNDRPEEVEQDIKSFLPEHDYIFQLKETSQFYSTWTVWLRKREENTHG